MTLTAPQKTALKAAILADGSANALFQSGDLSGLADYLNITAAPAFTVWKTNVTQADVLTSAAFDWTRVDNLTVGKARIWEYLFQPGSIDASQANIRTGIDSVWVGTQADLNVRAAVYAKCKRSASRVEKILATGTGTDVSPATLTYEGTLPYTDLIGL